MSEMTDMPHHLFLPAKVEEEREREKAEGGFGEMTEKNRKKVAFPSETDASSASFPSSPTRAVGGRRLKGSKASYSTQSHVGLAPEKEDSDRLGGYGNDNPRCFPHHVKKQCWDKADKIKGRDPERWRRDALGNIVFRKLVGCPGCLCHDYDHVVPFSKGGRSTLENCQVLQATVNRSKGNKMDISKAELIQKSAYCRVSGRDMDLLELSAFGNVRRGQDSGGCNIQ